jgi:hypothetical protein
MDMHELESAWKALDQRLATQDASVQDLRRRSGLRAAQARLRWLWLGQLPQLLVGLLIALWAGGYWTAHLAEPHLVVYGVAIHLYGIALLGTAVAQVLLLSRLDFQAPVLEVQRRLNDLAKLRIRAERGLLLAGFIVWLPMMLVAARAVGIDLWRQQPAAVGWNLLASVGLMALVGWLSLRFRTSFDRDAVGRRLREAEAELDAVESGRDD